MFADWRPPPPTNLLAEVTPGRPAASSLCPGEPLNLEQLTQALVNALPDYATRALPQTPNPSYVLVAGRPETQPLPLDGGRSDALATTQQVFLTTLERIYPDGLYATYTQHYHWIFLAPAPQGWTVRQVLTRSSPYPGPGPLGPLWDTTDRTYGLALAAWLRDCGLSGQ